MTSKGFMEETQRVFFEPEEISEAVRFFTGIRGSRWMCFLKCPWLTSCGKGTMNFPQESAFFLMPLSKPTCLWTSSGAWLQRRAGDSLGVLLARQFLKAVALEGTEKKTGQEQ
jgi:hypothetical protein